MTFSLPSASQTAACPDSVKRACWTGHLIIQEKNVSATNEWELDTLQELAVPDWPLGSVHISHQYPSKCLALMRLMWNSHPVCTSLHLPLHLQHKKRSIGTLVLNLSFLQSRKKPGVRLFQPQFLGAFWVPVSPRVWGGTSPCLEWCPSSSTSPSWAPAVLSGPRGPWDIWLHHHPSHVT